jgi:hypothetical protein
MAIDRLPLTLDVPYYEFEVELDGVEFKMEFRFNARDDAWFMTLLDTEDTVLRAGIKIVNEWSLLRLWRDATRPAGEIVSINQGNVTEPPTLDQLGSDVLLEYLDAAEIAALG